MPSTATGRTTSTRASTRSTCSTRPSQRFEVWRQQSEVFLTVNNVLDERAPLFPSNSGIPGLFYPTLGFHDDMGRFYTVGFRTNF